MLRCVVYAILCCGVLIYASVCCADVCYAVLGCAISPTDELVHSLANQCTKDMRSSGTGADTSQRCLVFAAIAVDRRAQDLQDHSRSLAAGIVTSNAALV